MNVLLLPSFFPTRREPHRATYVYEYARSLSLEHKVTVLYPQQLGEPGVGQEPFFEESELAPGLRLINYTYAQRRKTWLLSYLYAFRRVWRRIKREWKIDVIFAHIVLPAGPAALLLSRFFRLPVILTEHWGPAQDWLKSSTMPRKLLYTILRNTYARIDCLTAVSDSLAREINDFFGVSVNGKLDYPIDCSLFYPEATQAAHESPRVLCVTRGHSWDTRKGVPNLLSAWQLVAQLSASPIYLDIAGEEVERLAPQVEALGISQSCRLHPWMPPHELASLVRRASLVVIPSVYETFGRSGAEALASGVPVVATKCGGPAEYVTEGTGLLVPAENPSALAQAILAGLKRDNFLPPEELARRIRERFSYEVVCHSFTKLAAGLTNGAG